MIEALKEYVQKMLDGLQYTPNWSVLNEELNKLDTRDFEPSVQTDLLILKAELKDKPVNPQPRSPTSMNQLERVLIVLNGYRGEGSRAKTRSFPYIASPDLRAIIERDYTELTLKLFPSHAWKSTVIMAGSILEAILFDRLADVRWSSMATASTAAQSTSGRPIPMDEWTLARLINIAVEIRMLPTDQSNVIDQALRDYRNFVHPKKEIRAAYSCTDSEAMLSFAALNRVCDYIERNP